MNLFCTKYPEKCNLRWSSNLKMNMYQKPRFILVHSILVLLFLESCLVTTVFSRSTNIVFENSVYKNVLLAIDSNAEVATCKQLVQNLKTSLESLSSKLYAATDGKASMGSVDFLLPSKWSVNDIKTYCDNPVLVEAKVFQTYDDADIKVTTEHPIAKSLPWTKQYRGCGQEADSIYIPFVFLNATTFNETISIKGNFLLHEWAKFRYGVFEEFGFFGDEHFSPCYVKNGHSNFTSCSNAAVLTEIAEEALSDENCKTRVNAVAARIKEELSKGKSSIMASPHLANVDTFCTSSTHNRLASTKHNFMCSRKSVSEVLFSHKDFQNTGKRKTPFQNVNIDFRFIRGGNVGNGYAFIIEDSEAIRDKGRLKVIKQAVTQMVNMMGPNTAVGLFRFNGNVKVNPEFRGLGSDDNKIEFINLLPDQNTSPPTLTKSNLKYMSRDMQVEEIFKLAFESLKSHRGAFKYKIILIGNEPPTGIDKAINLTKQEPYSVAIATFDNSTDWLKWNTIEHTERVLYIPPCSEAQCNGILTSVLTDSLLEILGNSQPRQFFNKVAGSPLTGNDTFKIGGNETVSRFVAIFPTFIPIVGTPILPTLNSPSGSSCTAKIMLNYDNLFSIDTKDQPDCTIEAGTWRLNVPDGRYFNFFQVYTEMRAGDSNLVITTALGHTLEDEIFPTGNIVPVYASVSSSSDQPIINASVNLDLFLSDVPNFTLPLLDDGKYPDVIKNDGVYSAVLRNYSPDPATHLGRISVKTTADTRKIVASSPVGNAALLDPELSTKCCGSEVPLQNGILQVVAESFYSAFISSFKTNSTFNSSEIPPSKIQSIKMADNSDGASVVLEFISVDIVHHYDVCCFLEIGDMSCSAISQVCDCVPVAAGSVQRCSIQKAQLLQIVNGSSGIIYCGIRGVSSTNITGDLSGNVLEIDLQNTGNNGTTAERMSTEDCTTTEENKKCDSISDGCLPIYIFWILIGCVAGLLLIVLIGLICICVSRCRNSPKTKTKNNPPPHNRNIVGKFPDKDSPLYNVYVNQAYIQDSDGQLKLVAADGELIPYDPNTNTNERIEDQGYGTQNSVPQSPAGGRHGLPPVVRRRSISANAMERENLSSFKDNNDNRKHVSWNSNNDDMNMTNRNNNYDDDYPEPYGRNFSPSNEPNLYRGNSQSEEFITVVPKAKDRFPKPIVGYANPSKTQSARSEATTMTPVPSITSTVEAHNRTNFLNNNVDDEGSLGPIYASVNRNGHRPFGNNSNQGGVPVFNRFGVANHPTSNPIVPKKPQTIGAQSNNSTGENNPLGTGRFVRGYNNPTGKSVRLDAFPSSDSETYSDISRGVPLPPAPPLPPPLPSTGDLNRTNKLPRTAGRDRSAHRTIGDGSERIDKSSARTPLRQSPLAAPVPTSRTPPNDNSFAGLRSHIEQQMKNNGFNRPPPPPRHDKLPISSVSSFGSRAVEMGEVNQEEDYDEGSDFWDDGDDLEDFNQGQSYA